MWSRSVMFVSITVFLSMHFTHEGERGMVFVRK